MLELDESGSAGDDGAGDGGGAGGGIGETLTGDAGVDALLEGAESCS